MSTSKKRRKAREWMQTQTEKQERERKFRDASYQASLAREIARLTRVVPKEDRRGYGNEVFYPQGKIEKPYIRIAIRDDLPAAIYDPREIDYLRHVHVEHMSLRATQHALVLPDGTRVVWFGWEMDR